MWLLKHILLSVMQRSKKGKYLMLEINRHCPLGMNTAPVDGECGDFNYFCFYNYEVCIFYKNKSQNTM